jgi:hypothetical protein
MAPRPLARSVRQVGRQAVSGQVRFQRSDLGGDQGVFSSHFIQKILGFDSLFCKMELNIIQIFWQKSIYSPFWILASRGQKKAKKPKSSHPPN